MALTEHMGKLLDAAHEAYVRAYGRTLVQFGDRHAMGIKAAVEAVLAEQPRAAEQPPAGDVVERMCSDYGNLTGTDPDPVAMAAALAIAREGYVSLDDVLDSLSKDEIAEIEHIFGDCSKQQIDYLISSRRARLAKPAEQTDVQKTKAFFAISSLTSIIHSANRKWWEDSDGAPIKRNVYEILCLIHSEISEAMEGHRKNLMDDKLPNRPMLEVELADALIRIIDAAAGFNLDLAGAVVEKLAYNERREDHKKEAAEIVAALKAGKHD